MTTLFDPTSENRPSQHESAARLQSLDGARIGLLDISKPRGDVFLNQLQVRLEDAGASVERFSKPTFTKNAPVDLRQRIAERCDAAIEALAD